jgi:hypothetical protein
LEFEPFASKGFQNEIYLYKKCLFGFKLKRGSICPNPDGEMASVDRDGIVGVKSAGDDLLFFLLPSRSILSPLL